MDFDASSTLLATGSSDSTVRVWDIVKGFCTHNFRGSHGVISIVRFHPYKLQLFSSAADCKLRLWDLGTSAQVAEKADHFSIVRGIAFSPDGDSMYSSGRDKVHPHRVMAILSALLLVLGPIVTLALLLKIVTIDSNPNSDLTSTPVSRFDPSTSHHLLETHHFRPRFDRNSALPCPISTFQPPAPHTPNTVICCSFSRTFHKSLRRLLTLTRSDLTLPLMSLTGPDLTWPRR